MAKEMNQATLAFGEDSLETYKLLSSKFGSAYSNRELFLLAMAVGFKEGLKIEVFKRSNTGPRTELNEEDFTLMSTLVFSDHGAESLLDDKLRNETAMQYAEGGIRWLKSWLEDPKETDFARSFIAYLTSGK